MAQSALALKVYGGTPTAYRMVGATPVQIGSTFGSAEDTPTNANWSASNRIIKFYNNDTGTNRVQLCAWVCGEVYSYNETNGWTSRFNSSSGTNADVSSGIFLVNNNGTPTLLLMYRNAGSGHWFYVYSTNGRSWTQVDTGSTHSSSIHYKSLLFNNTLYQSNQTDLGHFLIDLPTTSFAFASDTNSAGAAQDMCVFGNTLYKIVEVASVGGYEIDALVSGSWTSVCTLPVDGAASTLNQGDQYSRPTLFDGGDGYLYAIYKIWGPSGSATYGYGCAQITAVGITVTATSISSIVFPASMRYATSGRTGANPGVIRWQALVETTSQPGSPIGPMAATPTIHLYGTRAASDVYTGIPWNYWVWNGPGALIGNGGAPNDSGGDASYAMPSTSQGNDRIWYPGDFNINILSTVGIGTNVKVSFSVFGPVGTEIKNAMFYFAVSGQEPTYVIGIGSVGVVSGSPAGGAPVLGGDGHHVQNLTADGNTASPTVYYAMWPATTEISPGPITNNEKVGTAARVY